MKKAMLIMLSVIIISIAISCDGCHSVAISCAGGRMEDMTSFGDGIGFQGNKLQWGNITYTDFGGITDMALLGKQIGIVDGNKENRVFEVKGQDNNKWLINCPTDEMGWYELYKADDVTDIPSDLAKWQGK